jgi:hypothetical protein
MACGASQLHGKLLDSSGAAGTIVLAVTLQNAGSRCSLNGYAGLRLAARGKQLPTRVVHDGFAPLNTKAKTVRLAHDGRATILIAYSDVPVAYEGPCPKSTAILIRPPGQQQWVSVAVRADVCNNGTLRDSPVLAGVHRAP